VSWHGTKASEWAKSLRMWSLQLAAVILGTLCIATQVQLFVFIVKASTATRQMTQFRNKMGEFHQVNWLVV